MLGTASQYYLVQSPSFAWYNQYYNQYQYQYNQYYLVQSPTDNCYPRISHDQERGLRSETSLSKRWPPPTSKSSSSSSSTIFIIISTTTTATNISVIISSTTTIFIITTRITTNVSRSKNSAQFEVKVWFGPQTPFPGFHLWFTINPIWMQLAFQMQAMLVLPLKHKQIPPLVRMKLLPPEFAICLFWQTPIWNTNTWNAPWKHNCLKPKHELETLGRNNQAFTITNLFFKAYFAYFFLDPCAPVLTSYPHSHIKHFGGSARV